MTEASIAIKCTLWLDCFDNYLCGKLIIYINMKTRNVYVNNNKLLTVKINLITIGQE